MRVLAALLADSAGAHYGFDLAARTGVAIGTIYSILASFESDGLVVSSWESVDPARVGRPRRRLYRLTAQGRLSACREVEAFGSVRPALDLLADPTLVAG